MVYQRNQLCKYGTQMVYHLVHRAPGRPLGHKSVQLPDHDFADEVQAWISSEALASYLSSGIGRQSVVEGKIDIGGLSYGTLTAYRRWILTEKLLCEPYFALDNVEKWAGNGSIGFFVEHVHKSLHAEVPKAKADSELVKAETRDRDMILGKRRIGPQDVIEISSDEEEKTLEAAPTRKLPPTKRQKSTHSARDLKVAYIEIPSSSDVEEVDVKPQPKKASSIQVSAAAPDPKSRKKSRASAPAGKAAIKLTASEYVMELVRLEDIPASWESSDLSKAFILDLSKNEKYLKFFTGDTRESKNIISLIRHEDQTSWNGGSSGHASGDSFVYNIFPGVEKEYCRRAEFRCQSIKMCEFFDRERLKDFTSQIASEAEMSMFWKEELDANEEEARFLEGPEARFYRRAISSKCRKQDCEGKPKIVELKHTTQTGKSLAVGCSGWRQGEKGTDHRWYIPDRNVNEGKFRELWANQGRLATGANVHESCSVLLHNRSRRTKCPFTHIIDGEIKDAKIIHYRDHVPCPSSLLIFVPVRQELAHMAVVIPKKPHNHPRHTHAKASMQEKVFVKLAFQMAGASTSRVTAKGLQLSATTTSLLNGQSWTEKMPGMTNVDRIRKYVANLKREDFPKGLNWEGVCYEREVRELAKPKDQRYIHCVGSRGDGIRLVVTMLPRLAEHLHRVRYLAIDYTFKRVHGDMNEWEVAGMRDRYGDRVSFASLYCNKATKEAFMHLFREFFQTVKDVTGKALSFTVFEPTGTLYCVIFDAEAAQIQGFGEYLLPLRNPEYSGLTTTDPHELVLSVTKTCVQHFNRNIDKLPQTVPRETINRLKSFSGLAVDAEIEEWHKFCKTSPHKSVRDWYQQKLDHPWYLPSVNRHLSPMRKELWDNTPNDTNIAETAHAARNSETRINAPLLAAINDARLRDIATADRLDAAERIPTASRKRFNGPSIREHQSSNRRAANQRKMNLIEAARHELREHEEERKKLADSIDESMDRHGEIQVRLGEIRGGKRSAVPEDLREEFESLQRESEKGLENRRMWRERRSELLRLIGELKSTKLQGARPRDTRSSSSSPAEVHSSTASGDTLHIADPSSAPSSPGFVDNLESDGLYFEEPSSDPATPKLDSEAWNHSSVTFDPSYPPRYQSLVPDIMEFANCQASAENWDLDELLDKLDKGEYDHMENSPEWVETFNTVQSALIFRRFEKMFPKESM